MQLSIPANSDRPKAIPRLALVQEDDSRVADSDVTALHTHVPGLQGGKGGRGGGGRATGVSVQKYYTAFYYYQLLKKCSG